MVYSRLDIVEDRIYELKDLLEDNRNKIMRIERIKNVEGRE